MLDGWFSSRKPFCISLTITVQALTTFLYSIRAYVESPQPGSNRRFSTRDLRLAGATGVSIHFNRPLLFSPAETSPETVHLRCNYNQIRAQNTAQYNSRMHAFWPKLSELTINLPGGLKNKKATPKMGLGPVAEGITTLRLEQTCTDEGLSNVLATSIVPGLQDLGCRSLETLVFAFVSCPTAGFTLMPVVSAMLAIMASGADLASSFLAHTGRLGQS